MQRILLLVLTLLPVCSAHAGRKILLGSMSVNLSGGGASMMVMLQNPSTKVQTVTIKVRGAGGNENAVPVMLPNLIPPGVNCKDAATNHISQTVGFRVCEKTVTLKPDESVSVTFPFSTPCLTYHCGVANNTPGQYTASGTGSLFGELTVEENAGFLNGSVTMQGNFHTGFNTTNATLPLTFLIAGGHAF